MNKKSKKFLEEKSSFEKKARFLSWIRIIQTSKFLSLSLKNLTKKNSIFFFTKQKKAEKFLKKKFNKNFQIFLPK